jgi:hypothetical protein
MADIRIARGRRASNREPTCSTSLRGRRVCAYFSWMSWVPEVVCEGPASPANNQPDAQASPQLVDIRPTSGAEKFSHPESPVSTRPGQSSVLPSTSA